MTNSKLPQWLILYGIFIFVLGGIGYATNPSKAISALIAGAAACLLSLTWALTIRAGKNWAVWAALVTTVALEGAFTVRAIKAWKDVSEGQNDKMIAAVLITTMAVASLAMFLCLVFSVAKTVKPASATPGPGNS